MVERLREVVGIGGGGNEGEVVDGGREGKNLFVYDVYVSFRQTRLSKRQRGRLHDLLHKRF